MSAPLRTPPPTLPQTAPRPGTQPLRLLPLRLLPQRILRSRWWTFPATLWWRSLPLRVVLSVFLASVLVLVLGGFLLMQQATIGVLDGKKAAVSTDARQAVNVAQQQLNGADLTGGTDVDMLLLDLATGFANRAGGTSQFDVIIVSRGQTITAGNASPSSIPAQLRSQVERSNDLLLTPTTITYRNNAAPVPGYATGATLTVPGTGRYQIYLVFPLTQEVSTLAVLRYAVVSTGVVLVILLTFIAALVSRQVVTPVRAARRAAESLASGNLHDRMKVRGQDDLARLATSMNYMASELEKQIKTLEELSAMQHRFVSDVSHELRTPLTTVRMAAEVLHDARGDFDPIAARTAELLQTELDRFEALLTDLLEISRFDAGAAVLSLDVVDLRDLVARVVEANSRLAQAYQTEITIHASGEAKAEVDFRRIERIMRNLLVNAIEHSEGQPIDILIEADESAVAVAVRDHGVGFEASQARQVFHRFWRADPARARTVGGTGLGLAISMEDANLHAGWLTAWGRPGLGAQFRLTLPRQGRRDPGDLAAPAGPARPGRPGRQPARRAGSPGRVRLPGVGRRDPFRRAVRSGPHDHAPDSHAPDSHDPDSHDPHSHDSHDPGTAHRGADWCPADGAGGLRQRADVGPGGEGGGTAAGLPELRQRRGRTAGPGGRAAPGRHRLSAGHLDLPAQLLRGQAVPDPLRRGQVEPRQRCRDLHRLARGIRRPGQAGGPPGRGTGQGSHLHRPGHGVQLGLPAGPGGRGVADLQPTAGPAGGGVHLHLVLPSLRALLRRQRQIAGAGPDLPSPAPQPGDRGVSADEGAAQRAIGVAQARRGHRHPTRHHAQRRFGHHHRRASRRWR